MTAAMLRKQFTVTDYARMRETGILAEDDRVELIAGELRQMRPLDPFHAAVIKRLNTILSRSLDETMIVSVQDPIQLDDQSEPRNLILRSSTIETIFTLMHIQSPMMCSW